MKKIFGFLLFLIVLSGATIMDANAAGVDGRYVNPKDPTRTIVVNGESFVVFKEQKAVVRCDRITEYSRVDDFQKPYFAVEFNCTEGIRVFVKNAAPGAADETNFIIYVSDEKVRRVSAYRFENGVYTEKGYLQ